MNCQPIKAILRYHKIDSCAIHPSTTTKKQAFERLRFKCVTRPDLRGVRLIVRLLENMKRGGCVVFIYAP